MNSIYKQFIKDTIIFFVIFLILTFLIYTVLDITINILMPYDQYEEPIGRAVKVISYEDSEETMSRIIHHWLFFLEFGE
ncbi:DUF4227 family protein [Desulfuribacillus alkaliarsenatis]|uniref:DUF4227 domain-containing protein n=1 Tax=Desulfuribacillus alkaliarsenatis TaxID=766136 RepID=A0A1E5G5P2_9FIRM|nr:DUF4227 family protein [Desulfuribacillus alkaliarsenatis]OEF98473.1 hypothetical protein BHF68_02005 [Desulfuribacillus alkaliarsenatis]